MDNFKANNKVRTYFIDRLTFILITMCMGGGLSMCLWCLKRPEEATGSPRAVATKYECREPRLEPLSEQPSLQPPEFMFKTSTSVAL